MHRCRGNHESNSVLVVIQTARRLRNILLEQLFHFIPPFFNSCARHGAGCFNTLSNPKGGKKILILIIKITNNIEKNSRGGTTLRLAFLRACPFNSCVQFLSSLRKILKGDRSLLNSTHSVLCDKFLHASDNSCQYLKLD